MWVEKYRPGKLDELVNQESVKERLRQLLRKKDELPHLLFAGPPGSGKTTTAIIIAKSLLGEAWNDYTLSLNASVAPETPVLVRIKDEIRLVDFAYLADKYYPDGFSKYAYPNDLEVLSLDRTQFKADFRPVANISRHKVARIAEIEYEGGSVRTTLDHSVMVLDDRAVLQEKAVSNLGQGDLLVTFNSEIESDSTEVSAPELYQGKRGRISNDAQSGESFEGLSLNRESTWVFGSYLAEGCTSLPEGKGGTVVLTYRYPDELNELRRAAAYFSEHMGLHTHSHTIMSGSSGRRSGIQLTVCSKQLASFFAKHFYTDSAPKRTAQFKRVPRFIFNAPVELRLEFLRGYMGDAYGHWQNFLRYSSTSRSCRVGASWLGRMSGLHTSLFEKEYRIVWRTPRFSYFVGELVPATPFVRFFERVGKRVGFNWRYLLRHQLYVKKSKTISKPVIRRLLQKVRVEELTQDESENLDNLRRLSSSSIYVTRVTGIKFVPYEGLVYDLSVPGSQTFWGGATPVLLHNSDERGIDMVRERVKTFSRYADRREGVPFRLVILDESDEMCLHPDTRVLVGKLEDLKEMSLRELLEAHGEKLFELPSFGSKGMRLENDTGRIVKSGTAELYRVNFEDGRSVLASGRHPFFVIQGRQVRTVGTLNLRPGVELADFSNRILRCHNCSRPFHRPYQYGGYSHHFCSLRCRNSFFGAMSVNRTQEERRVIRLKAEAALLAKGTFQSSDYRRKRSEIARDPIRVGKIPDPRTWPKYQRGEGAWLGKRLSEAHKRAIGEGGRKFFRNHPEVRAQISRSLRASLADPDGRYRELVRSGFFKEASRHAYLASVEYWKRNGFRSKIEMKMAQLLSEWRIPYQRESLILTNQRGHKYPFAIDFQLGEKIALLVNGCWWHVCPECGVQARYEKQKRNIEKDVRHVEELERLGYGVIVVWEHELRDEKLVREEVMPRIFQSVGISGGALPKVRHARVKSVETVGHSEVLNISVANNKNFLLGNGILTHNTNDAQNALRRIMEESSKLTRFILICNYSSGIIEPLQSRTAIFRFQRLDEASVTTYLREISRKEKLKLESEAVLSLIYESTNGDLRQAINLLQAAGASGVIAVDRVKSITGSAVKGRVAEIMRLALAGEFDESRAKMIELTRVYGIPERDFLKFANEELGNIKPDDMTTAIKILAEYDYRLVQGAQPELQLTAMLAELSALKNGKSAKS